MNHNDIISSLPAEVRQMILRYVLESAELWVEAQRPPGQNSTLVRRYLINNGDDNTGDYPPHPIFFVNRRIAADAHQLWQFLFQGALHVDDGLTHFPPQMFGGITNLTLSMAQAAQVLQVRVPHLPPGHNNMNPPNTQLILPQCPNLRHLQIQWDIPFIFPIELGTRPSDIQAALVRLQYFRRAFSVTIDVQAYMPIVDELWLSGTIDLTPGPLDHNSFHNFQVHGPLRPTSVGYRTFVHQLRQFGLNATTFTTLPNPQHFAIVGAHPRHEYAPLGWDPLNRTLPATPLHFIPRSANYVGPTVPEPQHHNALVPDPAARRNTPRPWDN